MTGKRSGRYGEKRYYHTSRGKRCPKTGDIYNRAINATALAKEMLRVLRDVLLNKPDLNGRPPAGGRAAHEKGDPR